MVSLLGGGASVTEAFVLDYDFLTKLRACGNVYLLLFTVYCSDCLLTPQDGV
jgi:hypothetical protein